MKHLASSNYRWESLATQACASVAAALLGWALALLLGVWADGKAAQLTPWSPFALSPPTLGAAPSGANVLVGSAKLVGVAGERAYFVNGVGAASRTLSLQVGDSLPTGERVRRIERDGVTVTGSSGEVRLSVLQPRAVSAASASKAGASVVTCRLSATERASAIFIEPSVVKALGAEKATFARMFETLPGPGGGIRAKGTGGTTAMFAIEDGDVWARVDGAPLRSSDAILTEVLARVGQGGSVVVEGERKGTPRRWVYAPVGCTEAGAGTGAAAPPAGQSSSASKSKG